MRGAACGQTHTVALCTEPNGDNGVYVWGGAENGKLGLGDDINFCKPLPAQVPSLSGCKVTSVACGDDFTLACAGTERIFLCYNTHFIADNGTIYSWGANGHGQVKQI